MENLAQRVGARGSVIFAPGPGKMTCLFCDDGLVYPRGVPPPVNLPLPGGPLPSRQPSETHAHTVPPQDALATAAPAAKAETRTAHANSNEN
jgi:hypothetical protein